MLQLPMLTPAVAASPVTHGISVGGEGVGMYPAFSPEVERYGVTTTAATGGSVDLVVSNSDRSGTILVNGRRVGPGRVPVDGLSEGDEISVIFKDSAGTAVHSLVYLPAKFPAMTEVVPAGPTTAPGDLLLNLSRYARDDDPSFEAVLDNRGVPKHVQSFDDPFATGDLKPNGPTGHYTVSRSPTRTAGRLGTQLVELDEQFEEVRRFETTGGLVQTDGHDSVLRPDGSRILLAYEPNAETGLQDAVIQEVDASGEVVYTWNSAEHMLPQTETTTTPGHPDYAHINSIDVMADGDILASFRHLSAVFKIAWRDHDGFDRGDVVWRLGGRLSDFDFLNDPYASGPCAQHTASELSDGNVLIFDNGSVALGDSPTHCVDPDDPTGPTVARRQTRITEYALDPAAGTATLVWSYQVPDRFAFFAGSARRLLNGNTLIGWAAERRVTASEVNVAGEVVWALKNDDNFMAYRVARAVVPDAIKPVVEVEVPAEGASYAQGQAVTPVVTCTDKGGSSLQSCTPSRTSLDTSTPGTHTFTVTATDGDGNTERVTRRYDVTAPAPTSRPDLSIRTAGGRWVGDNAYGGTSDQQVAQTLRRRGARKTAFVRVQSEGNRSDRITVRGSRGNRKFGVRYYLGRRDVTSRVVAGTLRRDLRAGAHVDLKVVAKRLRPARAGNRYRIVVTGTSALDGRPRDQVAERLKATRR